MARKRIGAIIRDQGCSRIEDMIGDLGSERAGLLFGLRFEEGLILSGFFHTWILQNFGWKAMIGQNERWENRPCSCQGCSVIFD